MTNTRGEEAAGSPVMSKAPAYSKKGTLFSVEDETSHDVTLLGEGVGMKSMNMVLITGTCSGTMKHGKERHRYIMCRLTRQVSEMSLDIDCIKNPMDDLVETPGLKGISLERQPANDNRQVLACPGNQLNVLKMYVMRWKRMQVMQPKKNLYSAVEVVQANCPEVVDDS